MGICLAPTWSTVRNIIIHKYLAVAPAIQLLKVSVGHMMWYFAIILICLLPSYHGVEKMSVGHANENEIYIMYFIVYCLKITEYNFLQYYKSPSFHPKSRIVTLQHAPGNPKKVCRSVCRSQNVFPLSLQM